MVRRRAFLYPLLVTICNLCLRIASGSCSILFLFIVFIDYQLAAGHVRVCMSTGPVLVNDIGTKLQRFGPATAIACLH
jgi:hypothetical protein